MSSEKPRVFHVKEVSVFKNSSKTRPMRVFSGRFLAKDPKSGARKAFNAFCNKNRKKRTCEMKIVVGESTKDKDFSYVFQRIYDPQEIERDGKQIIYKYKTMSRSLNKKTS